MLIFQDLFSMKVNVSNLNELIVAKKEIAIILEKKILSVLDKKKEEVLLQKSINLLKKESQEKLNKAEVLSLQLIELKKNIITLENDIKNYRKEKELILEAMQPLEEKRKFKLAKDKTNKIQNILDKTDKKIEMLDKRRWSVGLTQD